MIKLVFNITNETFAESIFVEVQLLSVAAAPCNLYEKPVAFLDKRNANYLVTSQFRSIYLNITFFFFLAMFEISQTYQQRPTSV